MTDGFCNRCHEPSHNLRAGRCARCACRESLDDLREALVKVFYLREITEWLDRCLRRITKK